MNNNNNDEHIHKLEREIWLFEQWLQSMEGQPGETQERIRHAYKECITSRKLELARLQSHQSSPLQSDVSKAGY
ncbi:MAG: hypothetical protein HWE18_00750 [Gammaproteobacteria bacterium]|nr:hypothetical protein [Gammaproteobacteria bacterium]